MQYTYILRLFTNSNFAALGVILHIFNHLSWFKCMFIKITIARQILFTINYENYLKYINLIIF